MKDNHFRAVIFLIIASILWSTGGLLIKLIDWNPMGIAGMRSGIAAIVMMIYLKNPKVKVTKLKLGGAIAYASTVTLFVIANKLTTSANVIMLQFTAPIWVAIFSGIFLKEKAKVKDWISIFFVMVGMVLFFVGDINTGRIAGNIVAIFSGVSLAFVVIFLKLQKDSSPVEMTYLGNIIAFAINIPFILTINFTFKSIVGILLLGIFQLGFSYILYAEASRHLSAIEAILIPVIEPLLNPIWVFVFTSEAPGKFAIFGGIIVISSVVSRNFFDNNKRKKRKLEFR